MQVRTDRRRKSGSCRPKSDPSRKQIWKERITWPGSLVRSAFGDGWSKSDRADGMNRMEVCIAEPARELDVWPAAFLEN